MVGNKNTTHNNILKKLIIKKWAGVMFLFLENFNWIISAKNESENKNIWIIKTCWNVIFILKICTINKFTTAEIINKIALLRLDTDYYESTKAEFEFLYPKLSVNGVLIVDDYGVWKGARKATDEYFEKIKSRIFLSRINPLGAIIGIKTQ